MNPFRQQLLQLSRERSKSKQIQISKELKTVVEKELENMRRKREFEEIVDGAYQKVVSRIIDRIEQEGETSFDLEICSARPNGGFAESDESCFAAMAQRVEAIGINCSDVSKARPGLGLNSSRRMYYIQVY